MYAVSSVWAMVDQLHVGLVLQFWRNLILTVVNLQEILHLGTCT